MNAINPPARSAARVLVVGIMVLLAACGGRSTQSAGPEVGSGEAGTSRVVVENQSTAQMRIYAVSVGQRVRIGTVNGLATQTLTIPEYLVGGGRSLSFIADPLAGQGAAQTIELYVSPGDAVRLVIPSQLR